MAVDPDLAVPVDAIELHEHQPARVPLGYGERLAVPAHAAGERAAARSGGVRVAELPLDAPVVRQIQAAPTDRKSTRLNSSHSQISYAVFCLKKKNKKSIAATDLPKETTQKS